MSKYFFLPIFIIISFSHFPVYAFPIATFNLGHPISSPTQNYDSLQIKKLYDVMKKSKAKLFALQEVSEDTFWKLFKIFPDNWEGELSSKGRQDKRLAFLWDKRVFEKSSMPKSCLDNEDFNFQSIDKNITLTTKLYDRPPFEIKLLYKKLNMNIVFINIHLRSQTPRKDLGGIDKDRYPLYKWDAQIAALRFLRRPNTIFLGDFNRDNRDEKILELNIEIHRLKDGFSHDKYLANIDFFGFYELEAQLQNRDWKVYEIESCIKRDFTGNEIPDHDIIVLNY
jgi:hypothetical protein